MSPPLVVALLILLLAVGFHLYWALGGRIGFGVSLPQRPDGTPVLAHRIRWWRPAAGAVAVGLVGLAALTLAAAGQLALPVPTRAAKGAVALAGMAFVLRALLPTPWTGFFKRIRTTRWARFDSWVYSPLFLLLGATLIAVALGS